MQIPIAALLTFAITGGALVQSGRAQGKTTETQPEKPTGALSTHDGRFVFGKEIIRKKGGVVVRYDNGDVFVPDRMIQDVFSTSKDFQYEPKNDKERKKLARGLVPFQGKWLKPLLAKRRIAEFRKKLAARLQTQRDRKEWVNHATVETRTFRFNYNIPDDLFNDLKVLFEVYYKTFTGYWKKKTKLAHKPTINIYADHGDFSQVSGAKGGIVGYYHPGSNELHIYWDRTDPEYTIDVLFHETNHMLVDMIDGRFNYPHYIEEAMAEYYGASEWDKKHKKMIIGGIQAARLVEIRADIAKNKWMPLSQLIGSRGYSSYTWGWSFVHFLMQTKKYSKKWQKLWIDLAHKKSGIKRISMGGGMKEIEPEEFTRLLLKYTGHKKLATLEKEWHAYVKHLEIGELQGMEKAARKLREQGKIAEARKYFEKAVQLGSKSAVTYGAFATILRKSSEQPRAIVMIDRAIELDPLEAEFYYRKGKILMRSGPTQDKETGAKCLRLAAEMEPDSWDYAVAAAEADQPDHR